MSTRREPSVDSGRRLGESTAVLGARHRTLLTAALAAVVLGAGCGGDRSPTAAGGGAGSPPSGAGGSIASVSVAGMTSSAGALSSPAAGSGGLSLAAPGAGGSGGGPVNAGSGGVLPLPQPTNTDHCLNGHKPLPSDDTMKSGPVRFSTPSGDDTILQPEVLQWMSDNKWTGAHVVWHAVRGCVDGTAAGLLGPLGFPNVCKDYPVLIPADQNCRTAGDGYQFLLFHRHMIQTLKQLWPKHVADFDGFPKFPTTAAELPDVWNVADPKWNAQILAAAAIGDNIEQNLDKFPSEGVLGHWLQCPVGSAKLAGAPDEPYIGLHFNLHDQWSRGVSSAHGLNNGQVNITNYMFWKLHGWIDNVWEKYRVAKGLTKEGSPEMQKYMQDMRQSCNEMDIEIEILKQAPGSGPQLDCPPDVDEKGDFHTKVRPIFESAANHCASCHGPSQSSPYAGLTLGGQVSSRCIVERLKRASNDGGSMKVIEPGNPEQSFLYLKASGLAASTPCTPTDPNKPCNTATMPPSGRTVTDAELKILYDWIKAGAVGPT